MATASDLIFNLHGIVLRYLSAASQLHFQGLRAAAGHLRWNGRLQRSTCKRLGRLDDALVVIRHITQESSDQFLRDLLLELDYPPSAGPSGGVRASGGPDEAMQEADVAAQEQIAELKVIKKVTGPTFGEVFDSSTNFFENFRSDGNSPQAMQKIDATPAVPKDAGASCSSCADSVMSKVSRLVIVEMV